MAEAGKAKAVLIGATGAIGRCLLGVLLRDKVSNAEKFAFQSQT